MSTEAEIQADIDLVRAQFPDTQDLYREVCTILFFRHGVTPTANKLYQYVRKGSMGAPASALVKFWEDLREKSRVRIERPDLPEDVKTAAGDLVASLWTQAQAAAQVGFAVFQAERRTEVQAARAAQAAAEAAMAELKPTLLLLQQSVQAATDRALQLERYLAAERAGKEAVTQQLAAAAVRHTLLEVALGDARRDFATELEKRNQVLQRSEERSAAVEKRALMEIDHERTAAVKLQKEMAELRKDQARLQRDAGEARQQLGVAEGTLQEMRAAHHRQLEQLGQRQQDMAAAHAKVANLEQELRRLRAARPFTTEAAGLRRRPKSSLR